MPHSWSGGFTTTADVPAVMPNSVIDTKGKQPAHAGGEYTNNKKTEVNDANKQ